MKVKYWGFHAVVFVKTFRKNLFAQVKIQFKFLQRKSNFLVLQTVNKFINLFTPVGPLLNKQ